METVGVFGAGLGARVMGGLGIWGGKGEAGTYTTFPGVRLYCGFYSQRSKQSGESNLVRLAFLSQRKDRTLAQQEMEAGRDTGECGRRNMFGFGLREWERLR